MSRINIIQGEYQVSCDPEVMLSTLLGSCVSACIRDPISGIGGMNHFLLPGEDAYARSSGSNSYGVHLMELLVNGLMKSGAQRVRLEAKVFGGARMMAGLSDIGRRNVEFVIQYLEYENIRLVGGNVGGEQGRRLQYWPTSGRARQVYVGNNTDFDPKVGALKSDLHSGEIEIF